MQLLLEESRLLLKSGTARGATEAPSRRHLRPHGATQRCAGTARPNVACRDEFHTSADRRGVAHHETATQAGAAEHQQIDTLLHADD